MKKLVVMTQDKLNRMLEEKAEEAVSQMAADYQKELLIRQADIARLQGQINPHFLYNALECIRGQALLDGSADVARITQALSKFYRYSISTKGDKVTLEDELDNVESYMTIQQFRFQGRFTYMVEYDREDRVLLNIILPNLTIQPIIENAVLHAFQEKTANAHICVRIRRTDRHLEIVISDNGDGMDAGTLETLRRRISGEEANQQLGSQRKMGIALQNVNQRLKLYYGEDFGVTVNSCLGAGTDVAILVPVQ